MRLLEEPSRQLVHDPGDRMVVVGSVDHGTRVVPTHRASCEQRKVCLRITACIYIYSKRK